MTFVTFEPVRLRATKSGKCLCGKTLKRTYTFEQTINPFNRNKQTGLTKTWQEIRSQPKKRRRNLRIVLRSKLPRYRSCVCKRITGREERFRNRIFGKIQQIG